MRHFSVRPSLTMGGRETRGLSGLAGKPAHPPLTDIPIAAYVFVAVFDVLSAALAGGHAEVGEQLYRGATWVLIGGAAVSLLTALTGALDWSKRTRPGTQVRRTANTHAAIMITVTVIVLIDLLLRLTGYADDVRPPGVVVTLSVLSGLLVILGASFGGALVFDYGVNVETSAGSAANRPDEQDVMPGEHRAVTPSRQAGSPVVPSPAESSDASAAGTSVTPGGETV